MTNELEFIKLNLLPPIDFSNSSIPNDYWSNEEWLRINEYSVPKHHRDEYWFWFFFDYKNATVIWEWEENELTVCYKHNAYKCIFTDWESKEDVERLARNFIDWLIWNEPCKNQLALPWGTNTLMPRFRVIDDQLYRASYNALTENGVPVNAAKRASLVVAMDDARLLNFGRTPEQQRDVNDAVIWYWAHQRSLSTHPEVNCEQDY